MPPSRRPTIGAATEPMVPVTYLRGPSRRVFTPEDGVSRRIEFTRGETVAVTAGDADRIAEIGGRRFHRESPTPGTTPTPKEG